MNNQFNSNDKVNLISSGLTFSQLSNLTKKPPPVIIETLRSPKVM